MSNITKLADAVRRHRELYYNGEAEIPDHEFDRLIEKLRRADPSNPVLVEVGAPARAGAKRVRHVFPMTSLTTLIGDAVFDAWFSRIPVTVHDFILEPKMDGASLELVYEKGMLTSASLRGDGEEGEDVTKTALKVPNIPKEVSLNLGKRFVVRGEVLLPREALPTTGYANCRNAIGGILRRQQGKSHAGLLRFLAFDVRSETRAFDTDEEAMSVLAGAGFETVEFVIVSTLAGIHHEWNRLGEARYSADTTFDMDGLVVKVNDRATRDKWTALAGKTEHDDPVWAVAFKWFEEQHEAELLGVEMSVGRTGAITPVGIIDATVIGGAEVTRVSLCNFDEVDRLKLRIGSTVAVIRAGEVIPKVSRCVRAGTGARIKRPATCPVCGGETECDGPRQKCVNDECPARVIGAMATWSAKRDILGLGGSMLTDLAKSGVTTIDGLYTLSVADIAEATGSKVLAAKVHKEIERSRDCKLSEFIGSIGIEGIGRREVENLMANGFDSVDKLMGLSISRLRVLPGYGEVKARKIVKGLEGAASLIRNLERHLRLKKVVRVKGGKLKGYSYCFTGCRPTKEEEEAVGAAGGTIKSGVSSGLHTLVCKGSSSSSKAKKAAELGVRIISYQAFQEEIA